MPRTKKATESIDALVGSRVRSRRMEIKMSQEVLGNSLGLTFQQIQKYEKGTNRISIGRLQQMADALDADLSYFTSGLPSNGNGTKASVPRYTDFMATKDGTELMEAMIKIDNPRLRRGVVQLARTLA